MLKTSSICACSPLFQIKPFQSSLPIYLSGNTKTTVLGLLLLYPGCSDTNQVCGCDQGYTGREEYSAIISSDGEYSMRIVEVPRAIDAETSVIVHDALNGHETNNFVVMSTIDHR